MKKKHELHIAPIFGDDVPLLKSFRGQPLLILFFYLGCPGCRGRAIPYANRLVYEKTPINVIGVHSRFEGKPYSIEELQLAKEEFYFRFPYYQDLNDNTTFELFEAGGTPHWILLNAHGTLVTSLFGSDPNNALLRLDLKIKELTQDLDP